MLDLEYLNKRYQVLGCLGQGGFGRVYAVANAGQMCACKVMPKKKVPSHQWVYDPNLGTCPTEVWLLSQVVYFDPDEA